MSSDIFGAVEDELEGDETERPFVFEFGIVHQVDPRTLAVKAIIPSIDPDRVHDRWIHQAVPWVGEPGYGPAFAPAVGSEVLITGRFGQSYSLLYLCAYNTRHTVPEEFADGSRGLKSDGDCRLIADGDLFIRGGRVVIEADASVRITAPAGFFINGKRIA